MQDNKNLRINAMLWWHNTPTDKKVTLCENNVILGVDRKHETLTGSEIEKLYMLKVYKNEKTPTIN